MAICIEFSTQRYEWAHHHKPRGYRLWYFGLPDKSTFSYTGSYAKAKQAAAKAAEKRCKSTAIVQVYA